MDKYVDLYWKKNIEGLELSTWELDKKIHKLIHELLLMAEDDPQ